jgi:hypothetical protein
MPRFEFEFETFWVFYLTFVRVGNHVYLSRGLQVVGATWRAAMRIVVGLGDLV